MRNEKTNGFLYVLASLLASGVAAAADFEVSQKGKAFQHDKSPVRDIKIRVGDTVTFRNDDPFFHNIYSASPDKPFDLGSYAQGQSRKVTFDTPGAVEVQCAIHPEMKLRVEVAK